MDGNEMVQAPRIKIIACKNGDAIDAGKKWTSVALVIRCEMVCLIPCRPSCCDHDILGQRSIDDSTPMYTTALA